MKSIEEINKLAESFSKYQGIGQKTAERLAIDTVTNWEEEDIDEFVCALIETKKLKKCLICGNISRNDTCDICADQKRNHQQIMIVEGVKGLFAIEKTECYNGIYHVLNGVINFSKGIGVDDINLESLFDRTSEVSEVIIATNSTVEGEITAQYIKERLKNEQIKVTRLAHGLPMGGDLEYADSLTLTKALEGRTSIK